MIGRTVGGSYTLQEIIGVGGMGRVYRAEQSMLGRTVAVKVIHPHLLSDEQTVARFYNEARAASRLNHPNSVSIIDFGRTDDGIMYLVMEHITGRDLAMVMHEEGPLPFDRICDVMIGVLNALSEAHALDVVHRDLKPENVILSRFRSGGDMVKVVDFGLATLLGAAETSITRPGLICGTPDYMSPEQGQGAPVDGRGDLYSLGVVLFELLAERLPYEDETPTKVVLRHINDPIPDPRTVAPYRGIPGPLADVVTRAMAKNASDRYQTAREFAQELRDAVVSAPRSAEQSAQRCSACGADNPAAMHFCGACGARLTGRVSIPPEMRPARTSFRPHDGQRRGKLIGRDAPLQQLRSLRREASGMPVHVHLVGDPGVGKTRLLQEAADEFAGDGDLVVWIRPHPAGVPVPYGPVRTLLAELLGVDEHELQRLCSTEGLLEDPITRAGVAEVVEPCGVDGVPSGDSRSAAVADALAAAARIALTRAGAKRLVVVADEVHRYDGLSRKALGAWPRFLPDSSLLLLSASIHGPDTAAEAKVVELHGLTPTEAAEYLLPGGSEAGRTVPAPRGMRHLLPLYLEQLRALGETLQDGDAKPPRLADVVLQRVERLDLPARHALQGLAVLGERTTRDRLQALVDPDATEGIGSVIRHELARATGDEIELIHPFVRDLVEASIPAEARKELHQRALQLVSEGGEPLEVRAEHAYRAGEPMSALMLLERMGDVGMKRGDAAAAVLAFRRGLEIARREVLERGETVMDQAIVTFSRKLGEALERAGDLAGADGVLREAMDLTGPMTRERARMLQALGEVAMRRGRRRDAIRLLGQALEVATELREASTQGRAQLTLARARREDGDAIGAANAYRRALESFVQNDAPAALRARVMLELGESLLDVGDTEAASEQLEEAVRMASQHEAWSLSASALGALASMDEVAGDRERAAQRYQEAATMAADAGDADGHARWRRAAASLMAS